MLNVHHRMGKNIGGQQQQQDSSDKKPKPLQDRFWNRVHKMLHALNRRRRWHNVRKVLPNKRQGSGKHIIDGGTTEPSASTGQPPEGRPPEGRGRHRKNKSDEQSGDESGSGSSKASKKSRIRSLISEEMLKRKGKHQQRRSPSPTKKHSKSSSKNHTENRSENVENEKPSTQSNGVGSPSTIKKRKCDICAAMLTVSYLRQKALAMEQQKKAAAEENNNKMLHQAVPRIGPSKSFSFNRLKSTKRKDFEIEELKRRLRDCKDIETAKEKFILPMNQWKETGVPKPMLTRPESFKSPSTPSQKENNPTNHQSKSLKQKIGYVIKDSRKEKKRILMDAVFHKIPYGRRSCKDGKKLNPNKLKSSSTGSTKIDADKAAGLKKTSSSSEAMNKYRWLLNHTPATRDEKCHHGDYKPKLCVAEAHFISTITDKKTLKRVRSLPTISIFDFVQNPEFPVNTLHLRPASGVPDDQKPVENFLLPEKRNASAAAIAKGPKPLEKEAVNENLEVGLNISERKENLNHEKEPSGATESVAKEAIIVNKDETVDENAEMGSKTLVHQEEMGSKTPVHQEEMDHENDPKAAIKSPAKETKSVDKDEAANESIDVGGLDTSDHQEKDDQQDECSTAIQSPTKETELVEKDDENLGAGLDTSNHQEEVEPEKESGGDIGSTATESPAVVDVDKSFNEILGMFKVASDQKIEQERKNESNDAVDSAAKDTKVEKDTGVEKSIEDAQNTLDHQEEEKPTITPSDDQDSLMQDSSIQVPSMHDYITDHSSAFVSLPNSPPLSTFEDFSDNEQYLFSINDQPSTPQPSIEKSPIDEQDLFSIDDKRPKDEQAKNLSTIKVKKIVERFLHLDLESVKDNLEFLYVKEVLGRSGFLENQRLGEWYSTYQPIDPSLFAEVETRFLQNKNLDELETLKDDEAAQKMINDHHLLLFELINEALLEVYNKASNHCPHPLTYCSKFRPMPVGCRVLEEVWDFVNMYLTLKPDLYPTLDDVLSRDLEKGDGWMNLQPDAELVGIELEEMLTDDLLDELVFDDLLM